MKAVKWIIIIVAGLLGLFVTVTFFLPKDYYVERSVEISAPAAIIYSQVSDLKAWQVWDPWKELDPEMGLTFGDSTTGPGAWYSWNSEIAGDGKMTIIETDPLHHVRFELVFEGYETVPSYSSIILIGDGKEASVLVTWSFEGAVGDKLFARWMTLMMDKFVGSSYEKGLETLKALCESMEVEKP